jgi:hypothetical protein
MKNFNDVICEKLFNSLRVELNSQLSNNLNSGVVFRISRELRSILIDKFDLNFYSELDELLVINIENLNKVEKI